MEPLYLLDWALIAVSLFNTIAMTWLGSMVLLNAERRPWGALVAGGALLAGGLFYAGHSAVVGREIGTFNQELPLYLALTWLAMVSAPYLWYLALAWFAGVLSTRAHRLAVIGVTLLGALCLVMLIPAITTPLADQQIEAVTLLARAVDAGPVVAGVPLPAALYPLYSGLCVAGSLAALLRPGVSARFMGAAARRRARPWLIGAALALLGVCAVFSLTVLWLLVTLRNGSFDPNLETLITLMFADLVVAALVGLAVIPLGRAVVSYEIFTGKSLPRGALFRDWRRSLILASYFGVLLGASLLAPFEIHPIYQLLLATGLMTLFLVLMAWRSYVEYEQGIERLRPFVASQRLYQQLLTTPDVEGAGLDGPFRALCEDVLGARVAHLCALGPLATLAGPPLSYPLGAGPDSATQAELGRLLTDADMLAVPLDPARFAGAVWGIPLRSDRLLIGALLLGERRDSVLYTREQIEIARSVGERLLDAQAGAELARRLMGLQRQQLAESQVLDRQTRRVLHDEVLPKIHTVMIMLSGGSTPPEAVPLLAEAHREIANLLHAMPATAGGDVARLGLPRALRQAVERELATAFDAVHWEIEPEAEQAALQLPPLRAEVAFYAAREAVRNAARYGRGGESQRPLHLTISLACRDGLLLGVADNGVGFGPARSSTGGSGQGLALHSTMMAVIGGTLTVESVPGAGTCVWLALG